MWNVKKDAVTYVLPDSLERAQCFSGLWNYVNYASCRLNGITGFGLWGVVISDGEIWFDLIW